MLCPQLSCAINTHLGLFLQVKGIDLLQFSLQSKEEGSFVRLERGLVILERLAIGAFVIRAQHRRSAELFDELQAFG
jgi:hypothetical protein